MRCALDRRRFTPAHQMCRRGTVAIFVTPKSSGNYRQPKADDARRRGLWIAFDIHEELLCIRYHVVAQYISPPEELVTPGKQVKAAAQVATPSPAAEAGIQPGDIVIAFNGQETATAEELVAALRSAKSGDRVQLTVLRGAKTQEITVMVASTPPPRADLPVPSDTPLHADHSTPSTIPTTAGNV